jgi:DNA polymerase V
MTVAEDDKRVIIAIDLKSFYASVECIDRGLDPFVTSLVVADISRGPNTIIMAVTPYLKTLGIPSRLRMYDLPKVPNMIYALPRMERYINKSIEVLNIYLNYVSEEDLHVYSIDEAFLDVTEYLKSANMTKIDYAKTIIDEVQKKTGLTVTAGIGPNLFLAKAAMDIEAKHNKNFMACWDRSDIPSKLWPITPLTKMWSIGKRMEAKLNALGMYTIGDIATADPNYLQSLFKTMGREIWQHANGIDNARIQDKYIPERSSLSIAQTLFSNYEKDDLLLVIRETIDELIARLNKSKKLAGGISLWARYSSKGGFGKAIKLQQSTADTDIICSAATRIFLALYDSHYIIKEIGLTAFNLCDNSYYQPSLFGDEIEEEKKKSLNNVVLHIKSIYGNNSINRASSLLEKSNVIRRNNQIGGHRR